MTAKKKRIVITGMGVCSCFGNDVDLYYNALLEGKSGVKTITHFPVDNLATKFAAFIPPFDPFPYVDKKNSRRIDKSIAYTLVSGKKALEMAKIAPETPIDKKKAAIVIGSGMGGMEIFCEGMKTLLEDGPKKISPFFIPYILTNMGPAMLAMDFGFMGPNYSVSTACATSNFAMILAAEHLQKGEADIVVTGGSEAAIIPLGIAGFNACRALSQRNDAPEEASRPWDKRRDGFVMGEGGAVLVMETLEHAESRGAVIIAEYLGGGISTDAYHITEPRADGEGVALCIEKALEDAGITPGDVDYINAHATSTPAGDMAEIAAMKKVFLNPQKIAINSTKSMIGHCLGAASSLEAVATIKALETGWIHPTKNLTDPEEGLVFHAPIVKEKRDPRIAISNSFGFGGHNATVVFKKWGK
jgi:3-oxoacyl-[acyl-carrier-protein] synthase II